MPVAVVCGRFDPTAHYLQTSKSFADPVVGALSLREARDRLRDGLNRLPELASELAVKAPEALAGEPRWSLVLDQEEPLNTAIRTHFSQGRAGEPTALRLAEIMALREPLSELLILLSLDHLTVSDDAAFFGRLLDEPNLPDYISEGLPACCSSATTKSEHRAMRLEQAAGWMSVARVSDPHE
jgi:hypothetical protein